MRRAVDAFAGRALVIHGVVLGTGAIDQDTHEAAWLDIDVLDTALLFDKLGMTAGVAGPLRKEVGTAIARISDE